MSMKPLPPFRLPALAIKFSEGEIGFDPTKPQQIFRVGTFWHESYGQFTLTKEMLSSMVDNFKNKVRGIDLAIDYSHNNQGEAAGWFKEVSLGENGDSLWAVIDWTKLASQKLSDKEFRYISPEFHPDYQDNESLKTFGPTLLGAGLTNRPTIKNMEPVVQLAESPKPSSTSSDASQAKTPDAVVETVDNKPKPKEVKNMGDQKPIDQMSPEEMKAYCMDLQKQLDEMKLSMKNANEAKAMSEKKATFTKMLSEGKVVAAQEEPFLKGDMIKFSELAQTVSTTAKGTGSEGAPVQEPKTREEAETKVMELAEKKVADKSVKTLSEAIAKVLNENKELKNKLYPQRG